MLITYNLRISWELLAAYIIVKLLAYTVAIQDSIHKIPIDYGKFHVTQDMTLLLSIDKSKCQGTDIATD